MCFLFLKITCANFQLAMIFNYEKKLYLNQHDTVSKNFYLECINSVYKMPGGHCFLMVHSFNLELVQAPALSAAHNLFLPKVMVTFLEVACLHTMSSNL